MQITLTRIGDKWRAESPGLPTGACGEGRSEHEAIGDLIVCYSHSLGVSIEHEAVLWEERPVVAEAVANVSPGLRYDVNLIAAEGARRTMLSRARRLHKPPSEAEIAAPWNAPEEAP
jgi:hypothetical protein